MAISEADATTTATLTALEHRLQRLTFYLSGDDPAAPSLESNTNESIQKTSNNSKNSAQYRLTQLEKTLSKLSSQSESVRQILELESTHPSLFQTPNPNLPFPNEPSPEIQQATVLAHAPLYASTSSQLQSLKDLPPPPVSASVSLIGLHPRLTLLKEEQQRQDVEIAALRNRSARLLQRWYEVNVLAWGECWEEWERRLLKAEQSIRREEQRKLREDNGV